MYRNVGGKIKGVAVMFFILGIAASFIPLVMLQLAPIGLVLGGAIVVFGSLLSYCISLGIYGFGQLIENTDILVLDGRGSNRRR